MSTYFCYTCNQFKPLESFPASKGRPRTTGAVKPNARCFTCRNRAYRQKQLDKYRNAKNECFQALAGNNTPTCACCGEANRHFLTIDHIEGGGNSERERKGQLYWKYILARITDGSYQILCMNCNWAKGSLGTCPHKVVSA